MNMTDASRVSFYSILISLFKLECIHCITSFAASSANSVEHI